MKFRTLKIVLSALVGVGALFLLVYFGGVTLLPTISDGAAEDAAENVAATFIAGDRAIG